MISDEDLFGALTAELTQLRTHGTCVRRYTHLRQMKIQASKASLLWMQEGVETSNLCARKHFLKEQEDTRDHDINDGNLPPEEGPVYDEEAPERDPRPVSVPWRSETVQRVDYVSYQPSASPIGERYRMSSPLPNISIQELRWSSLRRAAHDAYEVASIRLVSSLLHSTILPRIFV